MNRAERRKCPATRRKHDWTTKSGSEYAGWLVCRECAAMTPAPVVSAPSTRDAGEPSP